MKYNPDKHHRRSIRLKNYDYGRCGAYFVTICTQDRVCLFGEVDDAEEMNLTDAGDSIAQVCHDLPMFCSGLEVDSFVIMPNHVHIIFILTRNDVGAGLRACPVKSNLTNTDTIGTIGNAEHSQGHPRRGAPTDDGQTTLPDAVYRFKSWTTKLYSDGVKQKGWPAFPGRLWQRNYYEHVIRDNDELMTIREYINNNPYTWEEDEENPNCTGSSQ